MTRKETVQYVVTVKTDFIRIFHQRWHIVQQTWGSQRAVGYTTTEAATKKTLPFTRCRSLAVSRFSESPPASRHWMRRAAWRLWQTWHMPWARRTHNAYMVSLCTWSDDVTDLVRCDAENFTFTFRQLDVVAFATWICVNNLLFFSPLYSKARLDWA